jgi:transposase-like protein
VAEVSRGCEVNANVLHRWRRELREFGTNAFSGPGRSRADENRIAALEVTLTIEALQMALRTRKPTAGLVHHSDRVVPTIQHRARPFPTRLRLLRID